MLEKSYGKLVKVNLTSNSENVTVFFGKNLESLPLNPVLNQIEYYKGSYYIFDKVNTPVGSKKCYKSWRPLSLREEEVEISRHNQNVVSDSWILPESYEPSLLSLHIHVNEEEFRGEPCFIEDNVIHFAKPVSGWFAIYRDEPNRNYLPEAGSLNHFISNNLPYQGYWGGGEVRSLFSNSETLTPRLIDIYDIAVNPAEGLRLNIELRESPNLSIENFIVRFYKDSKIVSSSIIPPNVREISALDLMFMEPSSAYKMTVQAVYNGGDNLSPVSNLIEFRTVDNVKSLSRPEFIKYRDILSPNEVFYSQPYSGLDSESVEYAEFVLYDRELNIEIGRYVDDIRGSRTYAMYKHHEALVDGKDYSIQVSMFVNTAGTIIQSPFSEPLRFRVESEITRFYNTNLVLSENMNWKEAFVAQKDQDTLTVVVNDSELNQTVSLELDISEPNFIDHRCLGEINPFIFNVSNPKGMLYGFEGEIFYLDRNRLKTVSGVTYVLSIPERVYDDFVVYRRCDGALTAYVIFEEKGYMVNLETLAVAEHEFDYRLLQYIGVYDNEVLIIGRELGSSDPYIVYLNNERLTFTGGEERDLLPFYQKGNGSVFSVMNKVKRNLLIDRVKSVVTWVKADLAVAIPDTANDVFDANGIFFSFNSFYTNGNDNKNLSILV